MVVVEEEAAATNSPESDSGGGGWWRQAVGTQKRGPHRRGEEGVEGKAG